MSTVPAGKLQGAPALVLAVGVVVLEFGTAVSTFVAGTLLPVIERDLSAHRLLPLLVAGTTVGMFTALPLSPRIIDRYSPGAVLTVGLLMSVLGSGSLLRRRHRGCLPSGGSSLVSRALFSRCMASERRFGIWRTRCG